MLIFCLCLVVPWAYLNFSLSFCCSFTLPSVSLRSWCTFCTASPRSLLCVYVSVCVLPFQFVDWCAATSSDNPLFTIHNPVSHLSSIRITILVCPFNKHLLPEMHIREWRISPNSNFLPIPALSSFFFVCGVQPVSPPLCTIFLSLLLVLVTACVTISYIFLYSRTAF